MGGLIGHVLIHLRGFSTNDVCCSTSKDRVSMLNPSLQSLVQQVHYTVERDHILADFEDIGGVVWQVLVDNVLVDGDGIEKKERKKFYNYVI